MARDPGVTPQPPQRPTARPVSDGRALLLLRSVARPNVKIPRHCPTCADWLLQSPPCYGKMTVSGPNGRKLWPIEFRAVS